MPDWHKLVKERLKATGLAHQQHEEITAELASHFEDIFDEARAEGLSDAEALDVAFKQITDWRKFARNIQQAKQEGIMNERTKRFWLPGFVSAAAASIFLMILAKVSYEPRVILLRSSLMIMVYPIWLAGQPLFGALGAYFSRRAGGTRWERVVAGLFPSLLLTAGIFVVVLIQALTPGQFDLGSVDFSMFAKSIFGAIVIPSLCLFLGTLPFLREPKTQMLARN